MFCSDISEFEITQRIVERRQAALLMRKSESHCGCKEPKNSTMYVSLLTSDPGVQDLGEVGIGMNSDSFHRFGFLL